MTRAQFIYRLSSILEHNAVPKRREKEKSGKINSGRLGKFGSTNRLFSRKSVEKKERQYSISILVDASGSMEHVMSYNETTKKEIRKTDLAKDTVVLLAACLEKVKGLDFEVTIFNAVSVQAKDYGAKFDEKSFRQIYDMVLKGRHQIMINEKTKDTVDLLSPTQPSERAEYASKGYMDYTRDDNAQYNMDGLAVYRVYTRLKNRPGKKVIVTFSDGAPTEGSINSALYSLGHNASIRGDKTAGLIAKEGAWISLRKSIGIPKREEIETVGIGIFSDAVKHFYKYTAIIHDAKDFYPRTFTALSKVFYKV